MTTAKTGHEEFTTDDLVFSAYLKMKGHRLIKSDQKKSKGYFTFEVDGDVNKLRVDFVNSECARFYGEVRNLKKMVSAD